jgi:hypothetical protein
MKNLWCRSLLIGMVSAQLIACGGGEEDPIVYDDVAQDGPDAGSGEDDVLTIGDIGRPQDTEHRCGSGPITEWPLHNRVSVELASSTNESGFRQASIAASGGGSMEARNNPFIYFDLESGEKVEITDHASLESQAWDLAFKRVVIRSNGADSGPGGVKMAKVANTTFEAAVAPTTAAAWREDTSFDGDCAPITDPIGNIVTAINYLNFGNDSGSSSWYSYGSGGASGVSPVEGDVYFVSTPRNGKTYKLEILGWSSGTYTLRWAEVD